MSDNGDYDQDDEYEQQMDDDEYEYQPEDAGEQDEDAAYDSSSIVQTRNGLKFEGKLLDHLNVPSKNAIYSVYRQLSDICVVDIADSFYSALLTARVKDQFVIVNINFPTVEPFFPQAPPTIALQSHFKKPNERYNIIFNCHPSLLKSRWNLCTNLTEILQDMIEVAKVSVVDMIDDDPNSTTARIVDLIHSNEIDISGLFPDNSFSNLPSFGVIKEKQAGAPKSKGTGYGSHSQAIPKWTFANHNLTRIEDLRSLLATLESLSRVDAWVIDTIYFVLNTVISPTITLDEFFRNPEYYAIVINAVALLPCPSDHIAPIAGLVHLYDAVVSNKIIETLEPAELVVVNKLEGICKMFATRDAAAAATRESADETAMAVCSPASSTASKKRVLGGDEASSSSSSASDNANNGRTAATAIDVDMTSGTTSKSVSSSNLKDTANNGNASGSGAPLRPSQTRERVVEIEEPFTSHLFLREMNSTVRLPAKWYRRLRIELGTMPDSLPNNVIVFTGVNVSQPNLMKILMFPESADTPYAGGCFEFDVFIPAEYPAVSPKVLLVTTGYGTVRFNPNLYNCGKVCLSLLGTWSGEPWNPEISSLTQVINSILFLIFIEHPYFNEPGYQSSEGTPSGTAHSKAYNQVIREGTLEFGYLDHFKQVKARQLSPWIIPGVLETWAQTGKAAAEKWVDECPSEASKNKMRAQIAAIDEAVVKVTVAVASGDAEAIGAAANGSILGPGIKAWLGLK